MTEPAKSQSRNEDCSAIRILIPFRGMTVNCTIPYQGFIRVTRWSIHAGGLPFNCALIDDFESSCCIMSIDLVTSDADARTSALPMSKTKAAKNSRVVHRLWLLGILTFVILLKTNGSWLSIDRFSAPSLTTIAVHKTEGTVDTTASSPLFRETPTNSTSPSQRTHAAHPEDAPLKTSLAVNIDYSSLDWIPVPPNQRPQKRCLGPLQHCCLGQCRQADQRLNNMTHIMLQPNQPVYTFQDVLIELAKHKNQNSNQSSCNLWFHGDSQSSDHFVGAVCQLFQLNYTLQKCSFQALGLSVFGADRDWCNNYTDDSASSYAMADFQNFETKSCPRVTVLFSGQKRLEMAIQNFERRLPRSFSDGGVLVFNPNGVHCNEHGCIRQAISSSLLHALRHFQTTPSVSSTEAFRDKSEWLVTVRETEPQHFNHRGGLFVPGRNNTCTKPNGTSDDLRQRLSNWRNEELVEALNGTNVPIIPLFDALAPLWQLHWGPDCTHYCYTPWRLDITWNGLVHILRSHRQ